MTNPDPQRIVKALKGGAERSLDASIPPVHESAAARLWRRHRWKIIAVLFLVLTEICLSLMGGTLGRGPQ